MLRFFLISCLLPAGITVSAQETIAIRRNQVGCYPWQEKVVALEGIDPERLVRVTTPQGQELHPEVLRHTTSPWSGKKRYLIDLGSLTATGNYRVSVGRQECDILVAERPYAAIAKAALRLFYLIRSGIPIELGGQYNRPLGHPDTHVVLHPSAATAQRPAGTLISSPFGWYDAGDYNKYVVNSAFTVGLMLAAYEQLPGYFSNLVTDIPESGNQTPDLLDEIMFNLRWLLTMQDPDDGGVYHKLTTPAFEGFVMPADCRQPRYVVAKSVTASLDFAACMADAARILAASQQDYPDFCAQATAAAERAYEWAKRHPDAYYRQERLSAPATATPAMNSSGRRRHSIGSHTNLAILRKPAGICPVASPPRRGATSLH